MEFRPSQRRPSMLKWIIDKRYGDDIDVLQKTAQAMENVMKSVDGALGLSQKPIDAGRRWPNGHDATAYPSDPCVSRTAPNCEDAE